jgi:hypothetical protein
LTRRSLSPGTTLALVGPLDSIDDRDQSEVVSRWPRCSADVGS